MADDGEAEQFGPNAWLVDEMYEQYRADPSSVSESWQEFFADYRSPVGNGAPAAAARRPPPRPPRPPPRRPPAAQATATPAAAGRQARPPPADAGDAHPRRRRRASSPTWRRSLGGPDGHQLPRGPGQAARGQPQESSTATSAAPGGGKVSFTHLIGYAVVRAIADAVPVMNTAFVEGADGKPRVVRHEHVGLGLAVDVEKTDGSRTLLVPVHPRRRHPRLPRLLGRLRGPHPQGPHQQAHPRRLRRRHRHASPTPAPSAPSSRCRGSCPARASSSASARSTTRPSSRAPTRRTLADLGVSKVMTITLHLRPPHHPGRRVGPVPQARPRAAAGRATTSTTTSSASLGVPYEAVQWRRDVNPIDRDAGDAREADAGRQRSSTCTGCAATSSPTSTRWRGKEPQMHPELDPATYGLTIWDLDREFLTGGLGRHASAMTLGDILARAARRLLPHASASSTCTSRSPTRSAGSRSRSRASTSSSSTRRAAPHPRAAQRGRGVREVPRHQVRRPEALRHRGRRVGHPDPRRRPRRRRPTTASTARASAWPTAAGSTCSPTSSARATTSSSRSSRATSTRTRSRARAT